MANDTVQVAPGGNDPREGGSLESQALVAPPSDRIAVVVNGNAKAVNAEVIDTLDQILSAGELFISRRVEEALHRSDAGRARLGTVLLGGGDGTFTVMVSDIVREARRQGKVPPRFGLLRLGTGNALAWVIGSTSAKRGGLQVDRAAPRRRRFAPDSFGRGRGVPRPVRGFGIDALVLRDYERVKKAIARAGPLGRLVPGAVTYAISATTRSLPAFLFRPVPTSAW